MRPLAKRSRKVLLERNLGVKVRSGFEMKLRSIETTPSPNCMKLNLDALVSAKPLTLNADNISADTPEVFQKLLAVTGIQSIFLMSDFITITRRGNADWQPILIAAGELMGIAENADADLGRSEERRVGKECLL